MIATHDISGLVLAGGRATRMGGADKGLEVFHGVPLALHAAMRLQAQVAKVALNVNRHLEQYRSFGFPVWPDAEPAGPTTRPHHEEKEASADPFAGPLAGMLAGLRHCTTPWLVTVPCDSPLFPTDLVERLAHAAVAEHAKIVVAATQDPLQGSDAPALLQPVFCLMRADLHDHLAQYLAAGGRKAGAWITTLPRAMAVFQDAHAFANANTHAELRALHSLTPSRPT